VSKLKNDLIAFINALEDLAITGKHEDTENEVSIYISDNNFETNYSCLKTQNIYLTLIRAYILNAVVSFDKEVFNETRTWINAQKRMSTLISVCGEKVRAEFFTAQREIIDTL